MNETMPAPTCLSCQRQAAVIAGLQQDLQRALELNTLHEARIKALEQKLGTNSTNSNRPPSTDPLNKPTSTDKNRKKRHARQAKGRKQGAQPGHKPHKRTLVPDSDLAQCHVHKPLACKDCSAPLTGDDPEPVSSMPP